MIEILRLLPGTNCRECGQPTCMVFATRAMEGVKDAGDCPVITSGNKEKLQAYLAGFNFEH